MGDFTKHHKGAGILSHRTETLLTASGEVSKACSGDTQADADQVVTVKADVEIDVI